MRYSSEYKARLAAGPPMPEYPPERLREFEAAAVARVTFEVEELARLEAEVAAWQAEHLRDLFGNPFRPPDLVPAWQTETVMGLARRVYELRDFSAMPILADGLQDAGCDDGDLLGHCRGPGPHVRGCWVVDLVLGKE